MANAITYIKNVGKSIAYTTIDVMEETMPVFKDFTDTNEDLIAGMYKSIKNIKKITKDIPNKIMENPYGKFAKTYLENLTDDIKTGKFYNKERKDRYETDAGNNMMSMYDDDDDDYGDFDFGDEESFDQDDEMSTNEMIDTVGEKTSTAISNTLARSAEYIVQGTAESNKAIYNQMNAIYGGLHSGMGNINQNIAKILEFNNGAMVPHFENSRTFYTEVTKMDQERNNYLKEILEITKKISNPVEEKKKSSSTTYSDLVTYEGSLDIIKYKDQVLKNINNATGGVIDTLKSMTESGILETFAASPISGIISLLVPGVIKKASAEFNTALSGVMGNLLMKLKKKSKNEEGDNFLWEMIGEVFGINTTLKRSIRTSEYEKGKIPFDGVTKKAIIEVIPTYLRKIVKALTGEDKIYDYKEGKFTTIDALKKRFDNDKKSAVNMAASDLDDIVTNEEKQKQLLLDELAFKNEEDIKQYKEAWEKIKLEMFDKQIDFNTRDENIDASTFDLSSDYNIQIERIKKILDGNVQVIKYADNLFKETDDLNKKMKRYEEEGTMSMLFNNADRDLNKDKNGKTPVNPIFSVRDAIVNELKAIHKEISYIRVHGVSYGRSNNKGRKRRRGANTSGTTSFDDFVIPQPTSRSSDTSSIAQDVASNTPEFESEDEEENEEDKDKKKLTFAERMEKATGLTSKFAVLVSGATQLAKKPADFIAAMFHKADQRLYDVLYGIKKDGDNDEGKRSFIKRLFDNLDRLFTDFTGFMDDVIIQPFRDKMDGIKDKAKESFKNFMKNIFGIDTEEFGGNIRQMIFGVKDEATGLREEGKEGILGKFIDDFKGTFKSVFHWVRSGFKDFGDYTGLFGKHLNRAGREKLEEDPNYFDNLNSEAESIRNILQQNIAETPEAATGMRRVAKSGLAVISEGEMIIPPDMNPFNIAKRQRNEKNIKKNIIDSIDNLPEFGEGKDLVTEDDLNGTDKQDKTKEIQKELQQIKDKINNGEEISSEEKEKLEARLKQIQDELDKYHTTFADRVIDEAISAKDSLVEGIRNTSSSLGLDKKSDPEKFKQSAINFIEKFQDHSGAMAVGATIGAGVSVLTGLIGGPLLGAAVGAGTALTIRSKTVQDALFGKEIDGERQGGIISKELSNNIKKYLPDMAKGATVGGIITALPIIPGGPVAGIMIGSALGFAKNNDYIQTLLFGDEGEEGLFESKEAFQDKIKTLLPKMGVGALAGLLAGPFGPATNIILGSALGFATDTNTFKDIFFGEIGEDGKRTGGLLGKVVDPLKEMAKDFKEFIRTDMLQPLANALDPIKKQFQLIGQSITDKLSDMFERSIGLPLRTALEKYLINPMQKFFGGFFKLITKPIKTIISAPFKMIGAVGDSLRARQIKKGTADYMSAQQRNRFRESKGPLKWLTAGFTRDRTSEFDERLASMEDTDVNQLATILSGVRASQKEDKDIQVDTFKNIKKEFDANKNFDTKLRKRALKDVKKGNIEQAIEVVKAANVPQEEKNKILATIDAEGAKMKIAMSMKGVNKDETAQQLSDQLKELGWNISPEKLKDVRSLRNIEKLVSSEDKFRNKAKEKEGDEQKPVIDSQKENTKAIVNKLDEILKAIKKETTTPEGVKQLQKDANDYKRRYDWVAELSDNPEDEEAAEAEDAGIRSGILNNITIGRYKFRELKRKAKEKAKEKISETADNISKKYNEVRYSKAVTDILGDRNTEHYVDLDDTVIGKAANKVESVVDKVFNRNKEEEKSNTYTDFTDDGPIEYKKDKNEKWVEAESAENQDTHDKKAEREEREKQVSDSLINMPDTFGGIFKKIFGIGDDKDKSWIASFFEKLGTPTKIAATAIATFGAIGWAKDKVFPVLSDFWNEKAAPYLSDAWNGKKDGFGQFIYLFNPDNPNGLLKKHIPDAIKTLSTYVADGMDWVLKNVLPVVVSNLIENLPTILSSITTGLFDGIESLMRGGKVDDNDGRQKVLDGINNVTPITSDNTSSLSSITRSAPSWTDTSAVNLSPTSYTSTTASIDMSSSSNATDKANTYIQNSGSGETPKALELVGDAYKEKAIEGYEQVKYNYVNTPYGPMTVEQVLNSDKVFATANDGTEIHGYEYLQYDNLARSLGIDIQLSEEEMEQNTKEHGGGHGKTVTGELGQAGARSFVRGLTGLNTGVKGAQKVIQGGTSIVGGVAGIFGAPGKVAKKGIGKVGDAVSKGVGFLNKAGQKISGNVIEETAESIVTNEGIIYKIKNWIKDKPSEVLGDKTKEVAKDKVSEIISSNNGTSKSSGALAKLSSFAKDSKLGKFLAKATEAIKGFFTDNTVVDKIMGAFSKIKGVTGDFVEKLCKEFIEKLTFYLTKYGGKLGGKAAAKLGAYTASAATLMIVDAVASFISGYSNANSILGIIDQPSIPIRVVCGIIEALNSVFLLGLVPLSLVVDIVLGVFKGLGCDIFKDLEAEREAAELEVKEYNDKYGTNFKTVEEFNNKDKILTKVGNALKGAGSWIGDKASNAFNAVKDSEFGQALSTAGDNVKTAVKGAGEWVKEKASNAFTAVKESPVGQAIQGAVSNVAEKFDIAKDLGSYAIKVVKDTWAEAISGENVVSSDLKIAEDDPYGSHKKIIYNIIKILTFPASNVIKLGKALWDKVKGVVSGIITIGKGTTKTVQNMMKHAWNGDIVGAFSQSENAESGIPVVDNISRVANFAIKLPMAIPTLLTSGIGLVVRNAKDIFEGIKTIGSGLGGSIKNIFTHAWNGEITEMLFSDQSANAKTGNKLVDTISAVANNVVKFPLAIPALLTATIGNVVRKIQDFIGLIKTLGTTTAIKNIFTHAWNGEIAQMFTDQSANAKTGNKLIDTLSVVTNNAVKIPMAIPALITSGIGLVVRNIDSIFEGIKTVGSGLGDSAKSFFTNAFNGNIVEMFTDQSANAKTGNKLVDNISMVANNAIKIPLAIPGLITSAVGGVVRGMTKFIASIQAVGTLSEKDNEILEKSKEGKISPFSKEYWKISSNLTGIGGALNTAVSFMRKLFNLPMAIVGQLDLKNLAEKGLNWIVDKLGIDDSETGRGSGIAGRGSKVQNNIVRAVKKSREEEINQNTDISNKTFISQVDPRYANKKFNIDSDTQAQTLGDSGCAPAAAAMAINATAGNVVSMEQASKNALRYKVKNDGVNATYFNDEFARNGITANYITSNNSQVKQQEIANQLRMNNRVVLMGTDSSNTSKANSPFGPNPHYVVANGLSPDGKYVYINDPEANTANIKYSAEKIFGSTSLGIAANVARGTKHILNKVKRMRAGRGSLPGADVAEQCWNYFRTKGFSEEATAGILGNFYQESLMNPAMRQTGGPAAGIAQWESYGDYSSRWGMVAKLAESRGRDWTDLETQLDFVIQDMPEQFNTYTGRSPHYYDNGEWAWWPEKVTVESFKALKSIEEATEIFERVFERASITHMDKRINFAKGYYERFTGKYAPVTSSYSSSNIIQTSTSSSSDSSNTNDNPLSKILGVFGGLTKAFGLSSDSGSEDSSTTTSGSTTINMDSGSYSSSGNVNPNVSLAEKQRALVEKMYSVQGQLKYAQDNSQFPGSRNPDDGSGDCSSTVQWAYKNVLGIDPGSNTTQQRTDADTYTIPTGTSDESKLRLGDLLLKRNPGHVEMYAGDGKMIGHGDGYGPTVKKLDKSGTYDVVRRWVGFENEEVDNSTNTTTNGYSKYKNNAVAKGSKIAPNGAYNNALKHIKPDQFDSLLPVGFNEDDIEKNKVAAMQFNGRKLNNVKVVKDSKVIYSGRASDIVPETKATINVKEQPSNNNDLLQLIKSIMQLLVKIVTNTDQLSNITKLLTEYITVVSSSDGSEQSKQMAVLAKQNLINAMKSGGSDNSSNAQLMRLIESTERIARE